MNTITWSQDKKSMDVEFIGYVGCLERFRTKMQPNYHVGAPYLLIDLRTKKEYDLSSDKAINEQVTKILDEEYIQEHPIVPVEKETCAKCRFWFYDEDFKMDSITNYGYCKAHPHWFAKKKDAWCGEFKVKEDV